MKLSQFSPVVGTNYLRAKVQAPNNVAAFGGIQTGNTALNKAVGLAIGVYDKAEQERIYNGVQDALNDYNRQINTLMYDETNGLAYTMQGKDAEGMQAAYTTAEEKIRNDIFQKYGISTDYQMQLFKKQVEPNVTTTLSNINKLQRNGRVTYAESQRKEDAANTQNAILQNPDEFDSLYSSYEGRMRANLSALGTDELAIDTSVRDSLNEFSKSTLEAMSESGQYNQIMDLLPKLRGKGADESVLKKYENFSRAGAVARDTKMTVDEWTAQDPSRLNLAGDQAWQIYQKEHPFQMPSKADGTALGAIGNTVKETLEAAGITNFQSSWGTAVAAHESARGTAAPGNNYFGYKYTGQGRYQDLQTEELDENGNRYTTMARFQVYDTPEDSGKAYAQWLLENCSKEELQGVHSVGDLARLMKKHGYYTDGEEDYVSSVEGLDKEYAAPAGTEEDRIAWEDKQKAAFLSEFEAAQKRRKELVSSLWDTTTLQIAKMKDAGSGNQDMLSYLEGQADLHPELKETKAYYVLHDSLEDMRNGDIGGTTRGSGGAGKASGDQIFRVKALIAGGDIRNADELGQVIQDSGIVISQEQYGSLLNYLDDQNSGKGVEIYASKEDLSKELYGNSNGISSMEWGTAKAMTKQAAAEYYQENKRYPTQEELNSMMKRFLTKNQTMGDQEYSAADLRNKGIRVIVGTEDPNYKTVYFNDGSSYDVHVYELGRLARGEITEDDLFFQRQNGMMS